MPKDFRDWDYFSHVNADTDFDNKDWNHFGHDHIKNVYDEFDHKKFESGFHPKWKPVIGIVIGLTIIIAVILICVCKRRCCRKKSCEKDSKFSMTHNFIEFP